MDHTPKRQAQSFPGADIALAIAKECSNLYGTLGSTGRLLFGSLNVVRRSEGDWLAMCKVTELDGMRKLIAFGAGTTYVGALVALNKTIAAARWKEDKPWSARPAGRG